MCQTAAWTHPAVDELLSQQAAHHVGAEVHDVLDLPEGLLHALQDKHTDRLGPVLQRQRLGAVDRGLIRVARPLEESNEISSRRADHKT